ncbi:hypothetical protein X751_29625 [Mesorhizobium sp. LNJC395A00]|nr:hypothetical protein X751_29625 [Mesorhizobium sp. LNJC395A00]
MSDETLRFELSEYKIRLEKLARQWSRQASTYWS